MQYLYRAYGDNDELLYVGISGKWSERLHQHERTSEWMEETAFVTIERFQTREEVSEAEKRAIKNEKPIHNKAFSDEFETTGDHFQRLKAWTNYGGADEQHKVIVSAMKMLLEENPHLLQAKRSMDIAWCFHQSYDWLSYHRYISCRNCEAVSRHGMFEHWASQVDERLERGGYYDR